MKYELGATDWEGVSLYRLITFKYPLIPQHYYKIFFLST